jgi:6-phosphogluconolactonase (cycloisomerase 2 family)
MKLRGFSRKKKCVSLSIVYLALFGLFCFRAAVAEDSAPAHVLYVESNDSRPGQNEILAYTINEKDGSISLLGTFPTGGTGFVNFDGRIGPDDNDKEIILNADKSLLFAVNGGSDTIAVFRIAENGALSPVQGSPFPSGGATPVSLGLSGDNLIVVNTNFDNVNGAFGPGPANYATFRVKEDGRLVPIRKSTISVASDAEPLVVQIAPNGKVAFGIDFLALPYNEPQITPLLPAQGTLLEAFTISEDGSLQRSPGAPFVAPVDSRLNPADPGTGYLIGFGAHPAQPILYSGEALTARLAVYTYDPETGVPSFVTDVAALGVATCWMEFTKDLRFLFTADVGANQIGVWNIENPLAPKPIQELTLKLAGTPPFPATIPPGVAPSIGFQLSLGPTGKFLYVTGHSDAVTTYPEGNVIHILGIQPDGTLVEAPFSPVVLPVSTSADPTGSAIR